MFPSTLSNTSRPAISEGLAECVAAAMVVRSAGTRVNSALSADLRAEILSKAERITGKSAGGALTDSDIPLTVSYQEEYAQLVAQYGTARRFGTVVPLGSGTAKLPKVKLAPAFGLVARGAAAPEKSPAMEYATFTAKKYGGAERVPAELREDQFSLLGTWLADYSSRQMARMEDAVYWMADGSANYDFTLGLVPQAIALGKVHQLGGSLTRPVDITLDDMRSLRSKVASAALTNAAYYLHRSHERMLAGFNSKSVNAYIVNGANGEPMLDGFPVRWVEVMPAFGSAAAPGQGQVAFADASLHWFGTTGEFRFGTSSHVYFATDEVLFTCFERFTCALMNDDAAAVLQLAAV